MDTATDIQRIIISGGGTGGHVYPAIAIGEALLALKPDLELLFVGAKDKLEMEKVPKAGFKIEGLWISGLHRKLTIRNLLFPIKLFSSLWKARRILRRFRPDVVVGVGGFASGPVLQVAGRMGIPTLIQEQNSYAGLTNKLLAKKVDTICVAYEGMEAYFPASKLKYTGNPVRQDLTKPLPDAATARAHFGLKPDLPTVFITGGSLGAASINAAIGANIDHLTAATGVQFLWQVGKLYLEQYKDSPAARLPNVHVLPFVDRMDLAYAAADLVICRSGAMTITELCQIGQPAILIPSPNVAEDHQTKNAQALAKVDAAVLIPDPRAKEEVIQTALELLNDRPALDRLSANIRALARPNAATEIARAILALKKGE